MAIKNIFAKALLLGCTTLVSQPSSPAQDIYTQRPEQTNNDYELIAGARSDIKKKASFGVGGTSVGPERSPAPEAAPVPAPVMVSSKLGSNRDLLEQAYLDAFKILAGSNKCSALLGGRHSITALNSLVEQLGTKSLRPTIAMQMSGPTTTYQSHLTGFTYRLFAKAELNPNGLFFRGNFMNQARVPSIGGYQPNTREARVTVLLHELGHLVKGSDKRWLLPDDGDNEILSTTNTGLILDSCRGSIRRVIQER